MADRSPYDGIMALDLSDDEKLSVVRLLSRTIEDDRYPLSPRIRTLKAILAKLDPEPAASHFLRHGQVIDPCSRARQEAATQQVKSEPGPPMTLGGAAIAQVQSIVWCKACGHRIEPDPAEMAARYGAETSVLVMGQFDCNGFPRFRLTPGFGSAFAVPYYPAWQQTRFNGARWGPRAAGFQRGRAALPWRLDGTVFIPAAVAGPEMDAVLSAGYDGVTMVPDGGHAYLPAEWIRQEYPKAANLAMKIERSVREFFE